MMASARPFQYIHFTLHFHNPPGPLPMPAFERLKGSINNMSADWIKYAASSWIIYTRLTPEGVYQKLIADVPELKNHSIFTFYFDAEKEKGGQQVKWVWDWLNRKR